jgi:hypothetical protein
MRLNGPDVNIRTRYPATRMASITLMLTNVFLWFERLQFAGISVNGRIVNNSTHCDQSIPHVLSIGIGVTFYGKFFADHEIHDNYLERPST